MQFVARCSPLASHICLVVLTALAVCTSAGAQVIDQSNIPATSAGGQGFNTSAASNLPIGQQFTPTLDNVSFVDLLLGDAGTDIGPGADFEVHIRSGAISGPILGTSQDTHVPDNFNLGGSSLLLTRLDFASPVSLTAGITYVLEVVQTGAIVPGNFNYLWYGDANGQGKYPGGAAIINGSVRANNDFWFDEGGVRATAVPEPGALGLLSAMLLGGAFHLRRRR